MLDGVKKVTKEWSDYTEVNTVYYDAAVITVEKMETVLKGKKIYINTFKEAVINSD